MKLRPIWYIVASDGRFRCRPYETEKEATDNLFYESDTVVKYVPAPRRKPGKKRAMVE